MIQRNALSVLFFIKKNVPKNNGQATIMIRLTLNGKQIHFNSKLEVPPDKWDQKANRVSGRNPEAKQINKMLDIIRTDLHVHYVELLGAKSEVTPLKIKSAFQRMGDHTSLNFIFEEHIKYLKRRIGLTITEATIVKYRRTLDRLILFVNEEYQAPDIQVNSINIRFIELFYLDLRKKYNCCNNTAMKYIQRFAAVMRYAERMGVINYNPFMYFKVDFEDTEPTSLTQKEVNRIYDKQFATERLSLIRDIFVFSCYTGLSFTDLCHLEQSNIYPAFDGNNWILIRRTKTNAVSHIPLLQIPQQIAEKYKSPDTDLLFPMISNAKTNEYLKEIGEICGIRKRLTFHVSRHTFATLMLNYGISLESLSRMMGHRSIRTTQGYARVTDRRIKEEMGKIRLKMDSIP